MYFKGFIKPPNKQYRGDFSNLTHKKYFCTHGNLGFLPPANEVWGKVIFSEACVKNSVHRGGVPHQVPPPDQPGTPPPDQAGTPPGTRQVPPRTRQVPPRDQAGTPLPDQAGTPPTRQVPPRTRQVPPRARQVHIPPGPGRYPPRDTVNARAVRILLECNLVFKMKRLG